MSSGKFSASASASGKRKESQPDPFYGYKDIALLSEFVIRTLFTSNESSSANQPVATSSSSSPKSPPRLAEFVAYSLHRTRLPTPILFTALFLLRRLKSLYPHAKGTSTSPHRLFLSSLMLAAKINQDDTFSNKSWTIVANGGGMTWELSEINQMERELFGFLKWDVVVRAEELIEWEESCRLAWEEEQSLLYEEEEQFEAPQKLKQLNMDIIWKKIGCYDGKSPRAQSPSSKSCRKHRSNRFSNPSPPDSPSFEGDYSSPESSNSPFTPRTPLTPESRTFEAKQFSINENSKSFRNSRGSISNRIPY